ncbi:uncharacterized protein LOC111301202 isoform X2 [Durio zibethinus]|uniref:Uncharacterized protein LOC111301202 isoform X2 n=1 Tax=Durio zibethinus TaxID=66656 RepID=A0A6P5ZJ86_DURZI|nr:uncharacterized protein LOC111301202 isoform X2 [Durio zibethinus]XP_022752432.1 uncharacterized protein LOC111301202 isoform X2 [Durio zibethinus]
MRNQMDAANDHRFNIRNIMKDIEFLGSSYMTWKERKEMENRKVVSMGGRICFSADLEGSLVVVLKDQQTSGGLRRGF